MACEGFTVAAKAKLDETGTAAFPKPPPAATPGAPTTAPTTAGSWMFIYPDNGMLDCSTVDLDFAYPTTTPSP